MRSMSDVATPSTPSRKRRGAVDLVAESPSKKTKHPSPRITSSVIPGAHPVSDYVLPDPQQRFHDLLAQYLQEITDKIPEARPAEKKRLIAEQPRIIAAMAALYAPWEESVWAIWRNQMGNDFIREAFVDMFGNITQGLVNACEFNLPPRYFDAQYLIFIHQGRQNPPGWRVDRARQGEQMLPMLRRSWYGTSPLQCQSRPYQ